MRSLSRHANLESLHVYVEESETAAVEAVSKLSAGRRRVMGEEVMATQYEFLEVWETREIEDRGRGCTTGMCDQNDGLPIEEVGYYPPAHPYCVCRAMLKLEAVGEL